jgi:hypothetical protein
MDDAPVHKLGEILLCHLLERSPHVRYNQPFGSPFPHEEVLVDHVTPRKRAHVQGQHLELVRKIIIARRQCFFYLSELRDSFQPVRCRLVLSLCLLLPHQASYCLICLNKGMPPQHLSISSEACLKWSEGQQPLSPNAAAENSRSESSSPRGFTSCTSSSIPLTPPKSILYPDTSSSSPRCFL